MKKRIGKEKKIKVGATCWKFDFVAGKEGTVYILNFLIINGACGMIYDLFSLILSIMLVFLFSFAISVSVLFFLFRDVCCACQYKLSLS